MNHTVLQIEAPERDPLRVQRTQQLPERAQGGETQVVQMPHQGGAGHGGLGNGVGPASS